MQCVQNRFLDMPVCNRATGANLFEVIDVGIKHSVGKREGFLFR